MAKYKSKLFGFIAGLGVAASVFAGAFLVANPANALAACPAFPSDPNCPFSGMCGWYCASGNCELRTACNLPPFTGQQGTKNGATSCTDNGATCSMGTACTVGCVT